MRYSRRVPPDLSPSALSVALSEARPIDLTLANPTQAGFSYPLDALLDALANPRLVTYAPEPLGMPEARVAVAEYVSRRGVPAVAEQIALTSSTSEAYALLLKLFCDPGDAVAVPAPSYPLVPHLAELEGVRVLHYDLMPGFRIDFTSLTQALEAGARAVVVVSPNNPTGNCPTSSEQDRLHALLARFDVPLIADEVFAPYSWSAAPLPTLARPDGALTFVLDGLSKGAGLPQLKLGWIAVFGPEVARGRALERLEWLMDAYLSVATPVQLAAKELLGLAGEIQAALRARVQANLGHLRERLAATRRLHLHPADGGWYATLVLDTPVDEETLVLSLARDAGVLVQPGYFYDFAAEGYLVVSLLTPPEVFAEGMQRLLGHI